MYRIDRVTKTVSAWTPGEGASTQGHSLQDVSPRGAFSARTLAELVDKAFGYYGLPASYVWAPNDDDSGNAGAVAVTRIGCNRIEDGDGTPFDGNEDDERAHVANGRTLWIVDYSFDVEHVETRALNASDLDSLRSARPGVQIEG